MKIHKNVGCQGMEKEAKKFYYNAKIENILSKIEICKIIKLKIFFLKLKISF
jgi:hypothetical protein